MPAYKLMGGRGGGALLNPGHYVYKVAEFISGTPSGSPPPNPVYDPTTLLINFHSIMATTESKDYICKIVRTTCMVSMQEAEDGQGLAGQSPWTAKTYQFQTTTLLS